MLLRFLHTHNRTDTVYSLHVITSESSLDLHLPEAAILAENSNHLVKKKKLLLPYPRSCFLLRDILNQMTTQWRRNKDLGPYENQGYTGIKNKWSPGPGPGLGS